MGRILWGNTIEQAMHEAGLTPAKEEAMKVQRKCGAVETYEVLEESTNYYIIKGSATFVHVVSKADYEPVQEWSDVTGIHEGGAVAQLLRDPGYRLVRHDVNSLHEQSKAYAYLLEKVKR